MVRPRLEFLRWGPNLNVDVVLGVHEVSDWHIMTSGLKSRATEHGAEFRILSSHHIHRGLLLELESMVSRHGAHHEERESDKLHENRLEQRPAKIRPVSRT